MDLALSVAIPENLARTDQSAYTFCLHQINKQFLVMASTPPKKRMKSRLVGAVDAAFAAPICHKECCVRPPGDAPRSGERGYRIVRPVTLALFSFRQTFC